VINGRLELLFLPSTRNMVVICWNPHPERLTLDLFPICYRSRAICATGEAPADFSLWHHTEQIRRTLARQHLKSNEIPLTFTSFPRLGVAAPFTEPYYDPADAVSSHSLFLPEEITNPHVRFPYVERVFPPRTKHTYRDTPQNTHGQHTASQRFQSSDQPSNFLRHKHAETLH
jgi:hypothetical protein